MHCESTVKVMRDVLSLVQGSAKLLRAGHQEAAPPPYDSPAHAELDETPL